MSAALFTMRCFDTAEARVPHFVTAFIVHGASEWIVPTAERVFAQHLSACVQLCARVHKTGPLPIHPYLVPGTEREEIDWFAVARRIDEERPRRRLNAGVCLFRIPQKESVEPPQIVLVEQEERVVRIEFDPESVPEVGTELLESPEDSDPPFTPEPDHVPKFLFVGSRWRREAAERIGKVVLIAASSLSVASDVCSTELDGSQDECTLVEWCCPIHEAKP